MHQNMREPSQKKRGSLQLSLSVEKEAPPPQERERGEEPPQKKGWNHHKTEREGGTSTMETQERRGPPHERGRITRSLFSVVVAPSPLFLSCVLMALLLTLFLLCGDGGSSPRSHSVAMAAFSSLPVCLSLSRPLARNVGGGRFSTSFLKTPKSAKTPKSQKT